MFKKIGTKDVKEAMKAGGHEFEVVLEPLYTKNGLLIPDTVGVVYNKNREDNYREDHYLGTVGTQWQPVQPSVVYEIADELIKLTDGIINGVVNLRGGSIMGVSLTLSRKEYIKNDPVDLNFIILNSFDGSHGLSGYGSISRECCLNQCNTSNKVYNLRHTKNVMDKVNVIKSMLRYYRNEIKTFDKKMIKMVNKRMSKPLAVKWFQSLFPKPTSERKITTLENQTRIFIECLEEGKGTDIPGVKDTCYGAFQALTEYINHHRTTRVHSDRNEGEVRFEAIHFGSGNALAQRGMKTITLPATKF